MILRTLSGLLLFAGAYAVLNWFVLRFSILYIFVVTDYVTSLTNFAILAIQAVSLLIATVFLSRKWLGLMLCFVFASAWLNLAYGLILHKMMDPNQLSWLLSETGQATASAKEFPTPILWGMLQSIIGIGLFIAARTFLRPYLESIKRTNWIGIAALLIPIITLDPFVTGPVGAERNAYVYLVKLAIADSPPARAKVQVKPITPPDVEKIVWIVDESIVQSAFLKIVMPMAKPFHPIDFGEVHSFGNCSAPSNIALRSGVDVLRANPFIDLRKTPSIWGYAHKAGYRTTLIDGQTVGPLQNGILAPERALIDQFIPAKNGIQTDLKIARRLNALLQKPGRDFIYVVLSGAHFQYPDHYPKNMVPQSSPVALKYDTAVRYSKNGFFPALLAGADRERIAVFYTSDHGQNVTPGVLPHCSMEPGPIEFSVPLIAILPQGIRERYKILSVGPRSHSQIFPTSLSLMGYSNLVSDGYDNDLLSSSKRIIWFGRTIVPIEHGSPIEFHAVKSGAS
jgi:glucan phosphoethanolaminetransferase (alkaline phosphatase superfamily)